MVMSHFMQAGITSGYQEKPCLNPKDRECPDTAPNKNSTRVSVNSIYLLSFFVLNI